MFLSGYMTRHCPIKVGFSKGSVLTPLGVQPYSFLLLSSYWCHETQQWGHEEGHAVAVVIPQVGNHCCVLFIRVLSISLTPSSSIVPQYVTNMKTLHGLWQLYGVRIWGCKCGIRDWIKLNDHSCHKLITKAVWRGRKSLANRSSQYVRRWVVGIRFLPFPFLFLLFFY